MIAKMKNTRYQLTTLKYDMEWWLHLLLLLSQFKTIEVEIMFNTNHEFPVFLFFFFSIHFVYLFIRTWHSIENQRFLRQVNSKQQKMSSC